jgi:hypothetical protein
MPQEQMSRENGLKGDTVVSGGLNVIKGPKQTNQIARSGET